MEVEQRCKEMAAAKMPITKLEVTAQELREIFLVSLPANQPMAFICLIRLYDFSALGLHIDLLIQSHRFKRLRDFKNVCFVCF